jgi:hypothetical protein
MDGRDFAFTTVSPVVFTNSKFRDSRGPGVSSFLISSSASPATSSSDSWIGSVQNVIIKKGHHVG